MFRQFFAAIIFAFLASGAYAAGEAERYNTIQRDLIAHTVTEGTVRYAIELFPAETAFVDALRPLVSDKISERDRLNFGRMAALHQRAYFQFISLPASRDVLFDFIAEQHRGLFIASPMMATGGYPGKIFAWGWAYLAQASVFAYEATGDVRYVDYVIDGTKDALTYTDKEIGLADGFGRDNLEGWSLLDGKRSGREVTLPGRILSPILQMAIITKDKDIGAARVADIDALSKRAIEILKPYLAEQVIEADDRRYFKYLWTGEHDAVNHMAAYVQAAAYAYRLSGDVAFRDFVVGFRTYMLSIVKKVEGPKGGYYWPYSVMRDASKQNDEALWKAAISIEGLLHMNMGGITLARADQVGFARSFTNFVIGQHYSINGYLHPTRTFPLTGYNSYRAGYLAAGSFSYFVQLDRWIPGVRKMVLEAIASRTDLFPAGVLGGFNDAVSYAHMLKYPMSD